MTSRYNNNDDGTPLLVCPRRAGKMEQTIYIRSRNRHKPEERIYILAALN